MGICWNIKAFYFLHLKYLNKERLKLWNHRQDRNYAPSFSSIATVCSRMEAAPLVGSRGILCISLPSGAEISSTTENWTSYAISSPSPSREQLSSHAIDSPAFHRLNAFFVPESAQAPTSRKENMSITRSWCCLRSDRCWVSRSGLGFNPRCCEFQAWTLPTAFQASFPVMCRVSVNLG